MKTVATVLLAVALACLATDHFSWFWVVLAFICTFVLIGINVINHAREIFKSG